MPPRTPRVLKTDAGARPRDYKYLGPTLLDDITAKSTPVRVIRVIAGPRSERSLQREQPVLSLISLT